MQLGLLVRLKKVDRGEHSGPLHVPRRLLSRGRALLRVLAAPVDLRLSVLSTNPHDQAPPRRLGDQPEHLGVAADPATAALEGPAPQRHRELCARRVSRPRLVVPEGGGVPPPGGDLTVMLFAPSAHGGRMAGVAMSAARARPAPAAGDAAEANEGQRRR